MNIKDMAIKLNLPERMVHTLKEHTAHIRTLRATIVILSIGLILSLGALFKALDDITIYIPPDLSDGAVIKRGDVPKGSVLSNTAFLWIEFSTWMDNGETDAFKNLNAYQNYFGANFRQSMKDQYNDIYKKGDLNRIRRVTLVPGTINEAEKRVLTKVRGQAWVVLLDVVVEDFYLGQPMQKIQVRYPLMVERVETNVTLNPIGMMITGLNGSPKVIKEEKVQ